VRRQGTAALRDRRRPRHLLHRARSPTTCPRPRPPARTHGALRRRDRTTHPHLPRLGLARTGDFLMDMTESIAPKSDQMNADDLISGPRTFTIAEVGKGSPDQPVNVVLAEFPKGRPFK